MRNIGCCNRVRCGHLTKMSHVIGEIFSSHTYSHPYTCFCCELFRRVFERKKSPSKIQPLHARCDFTSTNSNTQGLYLGGPVYYPMSFESLSTTLLMFHKLIHDRIYVLGSSMLLKIRYVHVNIDICSILFHHSKMNSLSKLSCLAIVILMINFLKPHPIGLKIVVLQMCSIGKIIMIFQILRGYAYSAIGNLLTHFPLVSSIIFFK